MDAFITALQELELLLQSVFRKNNFLILILNLNPISMKIQRKTLPRYPR